MTHAEIRCALAERLAALIAMHDRLPIPPRPYQLEALRAIKQWLENADADHRGNISWATGLGKTWLFSAMASHCTGLRVLIVVPTKVLLEQTARFVVRFTGGLIGHISSLGRIQDADGLVIATRGHEHSDIVITTDESFIAYVAEIAEKFGPHLIVWDECHWAYTKAAQRALRAFPEAVILGFSATPDYLGTAARGGYVSVTLENGQQMWADPQRLARTHFGTAINERTVRWGIENGWLAPFAWGRVECDVPLDKLPVEVTAAGLDYREGALQALMSRHWPVIVEVVRRLYADPQYTLAVRQVFAVCPSVKTAETLAKVIHESGVPSACISGKTPDTVRNTILASYAAGEVRFLTSVMVLREGWDAPNAEVCLMLRPTKSRVLYLQSMGRVLRKSNGGRKVALVVDLFWKNTDLVPLSAPALFGTVGQPVQERDVLVRPKEKSGGDPSVDSPYLPVDIQPRLVFVHPLAVEYRAGKNGAFELEGETWITPTAFSVEFGVRGSVLHRRIRKYRPQYKRGVDRSSNSRKFYAVSELKRICADIFEQLSRTDRGGILKKNGEQWGTVAGSKRRLRVARNEILQLIREENIRSMSGKDWMGKKRTLYSISDLRKGLESVPQEARAGRDSTFRMDGERWVMLNALPEKERMSGVSLSRYLRDREVRTKFGKDRAGHKRTFYALSDLRRIWEATKNPKRRLAKSRKGRR